MQRDMPLKSKNIESRITRTNQNASHILGGVGRKKWKKEEEKDWLRPWAARSLAKLLPEATKPALSSQVQTIPIFRHKELSAVSLSWGVF
jgi:hypothetical protein